MKMQSDIPLFYPVRTPEMEQAALSIIRSGQIAAGPAIEMFERKFADYINRQHVVTTSDMTNAIVLALRLADVKQGDEVATISYSCLSTNSAIAMVGAKPLWIDINHHTMSMCYDDLKNRVTPRTKAVILYHVAGYPADIAIISEICRERGIPLIEDCNNALGATVNGLPVGYYGDFAIYSFYPNRQINGLEGGALICPDEIAAQRAKRLRRYGVNYNTFRNDRGEISASSDVPEIGISSSFSQLNASVAETQLSTLDERLLKTRRNAKALLTSLGTVKGIDLVEPTPTATPAYWCFLLQVERRNELLEILKQHGIACSIMHQRNDIYTGFNAERKHLPGTNFAMNHILALPCGWWLADHQINQIVNQIKDFLSA